MYLLSFLVVSRSSPFQQSRHLEIASGNRIFTLVMIHPKHCAVTFKINTVNAGIISYDRATAASLQLAGESGGWIPMS